MRIAIIAPNKGIPVPPKQYGGTERSVYDLVEELTKLDQDITLFAEKGSKCNATKIIEYPKRLDDETLYDFVMKHLPSDVEIIHDNTFDATIARSNPGIPTVCSFRNASKTYPVRYPIYLSKIARKKLGKGKGYYVHNGINLKEYPLCKKKKEYLLFLGRPKRHKGVHYAIQIAKQTKQKLIIAGPETDYVKDHIIPETSPYIKYVGSVGGIERINLLRKAKCLLFPTNCFEAFGRVIIESLACGTPVITSNKGSVPEVMKGFPQFVCKNVDEMITLIHKNRFPSPVKCREYIKKNFSAKKMAERYLEIYKTVLAK